MQKAIQRFLGFGLSGTLLFALPGAGLAQTNSPSDETVPDLVRIATNAPVGSNEVAASLPESTGTNSAPEVRSTLRRGPVVSIGGSASLAAGDTAEAVVAIAGSALAEGKVKDAVVAVGGNATAESDVGNAVVAIGGDALARGKVRDAVVAVAGNATAYGEVGDAVVAIMGDVTIGSNAVVRGDVVAVGGKVTVADHAQVKGQIVEIGVAQYPILAPLQGVADWLRHCIFKFRLLAPQAGWYWIFVGIFFLVYFLIAVVASGPITACVTGIQQRPATTFLMGLLAKLAIPLIFFVLTLTGIGVVIIPFIMVAVFVGVLVGKVAIFEWLGGKMLSVFGIRIARPVLALITGFVVITLLYMVPFLSLVIYSLLGIWAMGVIITATFAGARRESKPRPPIYSGNPPPAASAGLTTGPVPPVNPDSENPGDSGQANTSNSPESSSVPPAYQDALTLPPAGFWERLGAAFLDIIIVAILSSVVGGAPLGYLVALAYFSGMWAWRGTTVGGIVLNLKVVRVEGEPLSFAVALVRGLAAALSVAVFFLGFLWMLFDRDKQTWHDKIAGTVVVKTPRPISLVCL